MATPENTLITRAEITSAAVALTGRKALVIDGDTLELGKTGIRDITGLINAHMESGRLLISREGNRVTLWGVSVVVKAGSPAAAVLMANNRPNTSTFRPPYVATGRAIAATGLGTSSLGASADVYVGTTLGIAFHGYTPGIAYQFSVSWDVREAWPAAVPGVADGDPIGV